MEAKAVARHVRIAPRKAKLVADLIQRQKSDEALAILKVYPQRCFTSH
jgi:large subunit ribosomal protein L22